MSTYEDGSDARSDGELNPKKTETDDRTIVCEITIPASVSDVWDSWTTAESAERFFAPKCNIDLRPGGAYEMLFDLEAEPGKQGGEGMVLMALHPQSMLAFTWNAPPHMPTVRGQMTHVVIRLSETENGETHVVLRHDGWGDGEEWNEAFQYFTVAWGEVVLPRLLYSFENGPVDWNNPPVLGKQ